MFNNISQKKVTVLFSSLLAMFSLSMISSAVFAEENKQPQISVYGSAVSEVVPDQVYWHISIRSEGKKVSELANSHAEKIKKVLAYLQNQKIKKEHTQTRQMNLTENWNYNTGKRVKEGYVANTQIQFRSDDLKQYSSLWSGLSELEGISIEMTHFDSSKRLSIQSETRTLALKAARQKAQNMAAALDVKIGKPILIEEFEMHDDVRIQPMMESKMMAANDAIVAPGQLEIRMQVRVVFALEQAKP
jgi:uncharacterized protein